MENPGAVGPILSASPLPVLDFFKGWALLGSSSVWLLPLFQFHFYSLSCQPRLSRASETSAETRLVCCFFSRPHPNPGQCRFQVGIYEFLAKNSLCS